MHQAGRVSEGAAGCRELTACRRRRDRNGTAAASQAGGPENILSAYGPSLRRARFLGVRGLRTGRLGDRTAQKQCPEWTERAARRSGDEKGCWRAAAASASL